MYVFHSWVWTLRNFKKWRKVRLLCYRNIINSSLFNSASRHQNALQNLESHLSKCSAHAKHWRFLTVINRCGSGQRGVGSFGRLLSWLNGHSGVGRVWLRNPLRVRNFRSTNSQWGADWGTRWLVTLWMPLGESQARVHGSRYALISR